MQNTPLHPLAEWGRLRFGGADVAAETRLADLEATLAQVTPEAGETAALLAPLLDIPLPEMRAPKLAPEELRRRQLAAVAAWILAGARTQPLVLAFEDLHWADPTTLDLMKTLAERGAAAPLFIVATTRPEFRAPWTTRSHHAVVSLVPLDRAEIRTMVATIAERHALSREVVEGVTDRTGGVPLFVEEVTRLLLEGGAQTVPPTLQQSLAARLDRLGDAREVAQIGAVLGREFSYRLLRSVGGLDEAALQSALEKLAEADLLFVEGHAPDATYRFKHALIQDAAYESLLKSRRQALHRRAAEALLAAPDPQPELVAHHFTQGGHIELAVEWWGKAGDAALRRSAFQEAIAHLGKAIEMADKHGEQKPPRDELRPPETRSKLHAGYALASMMTKGFGAEETKAALARAEVHAGEIRTPHDWTVLYGRISADMMRGDMRAARAGAEAFRKEAEALGLAGHALYARRTIAFLKFMTADFAGAVADLRTVIAESGEQLDQELLAIFGTDLLCFAQATLGHAIWYLGEFDESRRLFKAALDGATAWGQVSSQCAALFNDALVGARSGRAAAVLPVADTLLALAETNELKFWRAAGARLAGWARVRLGQHDVAEAFRAGLHADAELGAKLNQPTSKALLADVERTLGRHDEALAAVAQGLAIADETGEDWVRCWLLRLRGEVLAEFDAGEAEAAYRDALRLSVAQGARTETLLASVALARLYQSTARPVEAYAALNDAIEGFAPTPEMPAIAEAQALLAALLETDAVKAEAARRGTRAKLHTGFALATMMTKGFGADETKAALARAQASGRNARTDEYWTLLYGRINADMMTGDHRAARAGAETFLAEAEADGLPGHAAFARRTRGFLKFMGGDLAGARADLEQALASYDERRDGSLGSIFGGEFRASALATLAQVCWALGDIDRGVRLADEAERLAKASGQPVAQAHALFNRLQLVANFDTPEAVMAAAEEMRALADAHDLAFWRATAATFSDWARTRRGEPRAEVFRAGVAAFGERGAKMMLAALHPLLVDLELAFGRRREALSAVDHGLALADETGAASTRPYLMRLRGDALAEDDPAGALAAYREALREAQAQGARYHALVTALALAKRLQAAGELGEAHAALRAALEGLSPLASGGGALAPGPSPGSPVDPGEERERVSQLARVQALLTEAQALLAALAETEEVKAELRKAETRAKLHAGYAFASMMTKGFGAEESKAALARAAAVAGPARTPEFWTVRFAQINADLTRCDVEAARAGAEAFLADAEADGLAGHAAIGRLRLGFSKLICGDLAAARGDFERALADSDEASDADLRALFSLDLRTSALLELGGAAYYLGDFEAAERRLGEALTRARATGPANTHVAVLFSKVGLFGLVAPGAWALADIAEMKAVAEAHGFKFYVAVAAAYDAWMRARLGEPTADAFRASLAAFAGLGSRIMEPWFRSMLLGDVELVEGRWDEALAAADRGLAFGAETGLHSLDPWLMRLRGEALAESDPAGAASAFREALRIAGAQGALTAGLLAALALARLLRPTGETVEAHAILGEALAGFSPTPLFPAVAEAQALLAALAETEEVKAELRKADTRTKLHAGYALASMMTKGFAADETRAALARAKAAQEAPRTPQDWSLWYGRIASDMSGDDQQGARAGAEAFVAEAERQGLIGHAAFGRRLLGFLKLMSGEFEPAVRDLRRALADHDQQRDEPLNAVFGLDLLATAMGALGHALLYLGDFEEADRLTEAAVERAWQVGNPVSIVHALTNRLSPVWAPGEGAIRAADDIRMVAEAHDLQFWRRLAPKWGLWTRVRAGEPVPDDYREILSLRPGVKFGAPHLYGLLSDVEHRLGHDAEAQAAADTGLRALAESGRREALNWLLRLRGDALAARDPVAAEGAYREAVQVAADQGAPVLRLLAALSLAKVLRDQGRGADAFDALSPALEGFSPTPLFPPIAEAQALLARLS